MAKGRDKELIERRDAALARRYYYWTEVMRLRFDDALTKLSRDEFFISEERIMAILRRAPSYSPEIPAKARPFKAHTPQLSLFSGERPTRQ